MSSVPSVQPLDSHMHLEANTYIILKESTTPKTPVLFVYTMGLYRVTVPCYHLLFWCLSGQDPLMHTGMEAQILPAHLVSSFEHHCADPTSHLPRLGVTSVPCCPAYNKVMEQICWAHFRTGDWPIPVCRKHVPDVLLGRLLVMGHAPDLGTVRRHVCLTMRWTVAVEQGSHRGGGRLVQEASLHKANPSVCEMTSLATCQLRSIKVKTGTSLRAQVTKLT